MRYGWVIGTVVTLSAGSAACAQDKAAFCREANVHLGKIAQGFVDVIDSEAAFSQGLRVIAATHDDDNLDAVSALADAKLEKLGTTLGPAQEGMTALNDLLQSFCSE